jgi:hypothetical protein
MAKSAGKILISNKRGENRGEIFVQVDPFRILVEMKTEEENQGLKDLLRIIGMETRGIPLLRKGRVSYITLNDGRDKFLEALVCSLRRADLDARLFDDKDREVKIICEKPRSEAKFEYY